MSLNESNETLSTSHSSRTSSIQSGRERIQPGERPHHLRPEDAFSASSPPRRGPSARERSPLGRSDTVTTATGGSSEARKRREKRRGRSGSRRRRGANANANARGQWKKLLWVRQSYPDNYTDEETFLDHLQRNPRLRPYEFWPLAADSTVIVQHVCSVVIFVCCFTGIFQERVSPQTVVGWATMGTVAGWVLRDFWQSREEAEEARARRAPGDMATAAAAAAVATPEDGERDTHSSSSGSPQFGMPFKELHTSLAPQSRAASRVHSRNPSITSVGGGGGGSAVAAAAAAAALAASSSSPTFAQQADFHPYQAMAPTAVHVPPWNGKRSPLSPRMRERLATAKSAVLIYCSLLGLSPILKSLTKSTSSDSIWALSSWLMILNVFTFDYGAGPEAKFPASLSTNAALMASTVLASRLPSTTHVFSLTLFSIEVFGLFPVFRRHLRHHSWTGHLLLTAFLVVLASGGLSMVISGGGWAIGLVGVVLGGVITGLSMGLTSWWLIGLQRYKNEIRGPWDPARPVIGRGWD